MKQSTGSVKTKSRSLILPADLSIVGGSQFGYHRQEVIVAFRDIRAEVDVNFEEAGKAVDRELQKFVEFVEQKVRPQTRKEMAQLLRKASKNLAKAARSLEKP